METRPSIRGGVYTWTQAKVGTSRHFMVTSLHKLFVQTNFRIIKHCNISRVPKCSIIILFALNLNFRFPPAWSTGSGSGCWTVLVSENIEWSSCAPDAGAS